MFRYFFVLILLFFVNSGLFINAFGQKNNSEVNISSNDIKFKDGIYLKFDQVKNNKPILKTRFISNFDVKDGKFYINLLEKKQIFFFDDFGNKISVDVKSIWGYADNGILYVQIYDSFNKIAYLGQISHLIADITVRNRIVNPNFYSPYSPEGSLMSNASTSTIEMHQFLIDFDNGKLYNYDEKSLEILLMKDPALHDEYSGLKKKKQMQLKFFYIRKFNDMHPLIIPQ